MEKFLRLSGSEQVPGMPLIDSEVNHLRRLLAWIRTEYCLDENGQRGVLHGAAMAVTSGLCTPEKASEMVQAQADAVKQVPQYVRQAVKRLTYVIRLHESVHGVIEETS